MDETTAKLTRAGLNLIQQALSIFDSDLRLAVCNARYAEMFDLPDHLTTRGAPFEDTIRYLVHRGEYGPQDDPEDAVQQRVQMARAFVPHYLERQRPNGMWVSVEGAPLPQGGWVTVYTDITAIRRQEELLRTRSAELSEQVLTRSEELAATNRQLAATISALEEAKRELTEMEARIRLTTEMTPAHIAHVGRDLRYTYSNRRLRSVLPGRPADIIGLHGREALGDEAFEKIEPHLRRALSGEPAVHEFTHEASGRRIRVAFTPDEPAPGQINGAYVLSMDVTAETQARAALAQTRKRELAAQLTSGLAHDFANLLTIILGLQGRLQRMAGLPAEGADLVSATLAAARRGGTLLDRIAHISGPRELRPVATDIALLLSDLRALAVPILPAGLSLTVSVDNLTAPLLIDPGPVQDSLLNLILNARDAIAGPGEIRVVARPLRDTWLELTVTDTGPGFSAEALERGLDPFFTTKGGEGSGLGLSMVYDHAKLAGGTVRLTNHAGGAQVTIRLPLRPASASAEGTLVLLVEDSAEIRAAVRDMLVALGHQVIEAASLDEALELSNVPGIGLVLSDITLPGQGSGVDLLERLAARGLAADLRLMTSLPPGDGLRARGAARFPVLAKPFTADDLAAYLAPAVAA
jgi:signal transduction histidine kinase